MQSPEEIEQIIQAKIHKTNNKKTLEQMQSAIEEIKKEKKLDRMYAYIGLIIIIPALYYLFKLFMS